MRAQTAHFTLGDIVWHSGNDYRGVIVDVDPEFEGPEDWYADASAQRPQRHQPWYSLLVDNSEHVAYVAEENLEADESEEPVNHPAMASFLGELHHGRYTVHQTLN
ncbi:MAG TPA: heat shock protein HspQ [Gammaproteobacteria bacterium]|nr:heat shock protein HspQ [Gammaproteobacteria bacterium]